MSRKSVSFILTAAVFFGGMLLQATRTFGQTFTPAATITVRSSADAGGNCPGATCTLRAAIASATAGDTIVFDMTTVSSPITLASELNIDKSLTINGPGANRLTVSGNNAVRVFVIADGDVTLSDLTVANGNVNTNSGVSSFNRAAGIQNDSCGTVRINESVISGNKISFVSEGANSYTFGAGVSNETATCSGGAKLMVITGSTISGNTAHGYNALGGGIFNFGGLTIINSTISSNEAVSDNSGGAALGGGIDNDSGTLNLINTTISGNSVNRGFGSGIINTDTFGFGNGTVSVKNTIIAGNIESGSNDGDVDGAFNSQGYNLIGKSDGSTGFTNHASGNIVGTIAAPVDALLAPLANNGGSTPTHQLLSNSPAINAGSNALAVDMNNQPLANDQRGMGFSRINGGTVDIGAFEFGQVIGQIVRFRTNIGTIDVQLLPQSAPLTVANFLRYVDSGRYNGSFIHRSVPNFVIQGGGYRFVNNQTEAIPTDAPIVNEFKISNKRGTLAMAKLSNDPNSATSQWFFNEIDNSATLDTQNGGSTVFGQIINRQGLSVMDAIGALPIYNAGLPFDQLPLINYSGSGNIQASNLVTVYSITRLAAATPTAFDFDGDGKSDLSVFRPSNAVWYTMGSTAGFAAVSWGLASDKLAPADYDGDGRPDIAVWREDAADPNLSYFFILQSSTNTLRVAQFGRIGDVPTLSGDWDGDGIADPTVYRDGANSGNGQSYFYYQPSSQPAVKFVAVPWGIAGDKPVRGDFDGDGKQDAAVFRPSNGVWYVLQSSNNQLKADGWGLGTDKLIAADYDGDGKTDLAVLRGTNWYIRQSSDGQLKAVNWGLSSDLAAPADYDGDGKTDVAVYRDGYWYIIKSSNSQIAYGNFGQQGDVPLPNIDVQ